MVQGMDPFTVIAALVITSAIGIAGAMSGREIQKIRTEDAAREHLEQHNVEVTNLDLGIRLLEDQEFLTEAQEEELDALELRKEQLLAKDVFGSMVEASNNPTSTQMMAALDFIRRAPRVLLNDGKSGIETRPPKPFGPELAHVSVPIHSGDWLGAKAEHDDLFDAIRHRYNAVPFLVTSRDGGMAVTFTVNPRDLRDMAADKGLGLFVLGRLHIFQS